MNITKLAATAVLVAAITSQAYAGGPVLEDMTETAPERNNALPWIIGGIIILGLIASSGGDDAPVTPGPEPKPEPCVKQGDGGC